MIPDENLIGSNIWWWTLFLKFVSEGFYDFDFVMLNSVQDCDSVEGFVFDQWFSEFFCLFSDYCVENLYSVLGLDDLLVDVSESYDLDTCFNIL